MKDKGDQLEKRVEKILKRLGRWNIKRSVFIYDRFGNKSEIDLVYGIFFKRYVECKNYSDSVPLEMVAKFKEVLKLNNIPIQRGFFITTSSFTPRATTIGIKTIDGKQLRRLGMLLSQDLCASSSFLTDLHRAELWSYLIQAFRSTRNLCLVSGAGYVFYLSQFDRPAYERLRRQVDVTSSQADRWMRENNELYRRHVDWRQIRRQADRYWQLIKDAFKQ